MYHPLCVPSSILRSISRVLSTYLPSLSQISVMRPPNYTLLMIWIPVIVLASIIGYLKRENLHMLYNSRYWAVAAMVSALKGGPIFAPTVGIGTSSSPVEALTESG